MSRAALAATLLAAAPLAVPPQALAQRSRCGFGEAIAALRQAEAVLAAAPPSVSLTDGRGRATQAAEALRRGEQGLSGCGCARSAAAASEAALLAERALSEASVPGITAALGQARFRLSLARERLGREGCA